MDDLRTNNQGVYLIRVTLANGERYFYVGSSWGMFELKKRILNQHPSPRYRSHYPRKAFYKCMALPGSKVACCKLVELPRTRDTSLVKIAEAVSMAIMGTLNIPAFKALRPAEMPPFDFEMGLNRSIPLDNYKDLGDDKATFNRLRTVQKCLDSTITWNVSKAPDGRYYSFRLFNGSFYIPKHIAEAWDPNIDAGPAIRA